MRGKRGRNSFPNISIESLSSALNYHLRELLTAMNFWSLLKSLHNSRNGDDSRNLKWFTSNFDEWRGEKSNEKLN